MKALLLIAALALLAAPMATAQHRAKDRVTLANYNRIHVGDDSAHVRAVLGNPDDVMQDALVNFATTWTFKPRRGHGMAVVNLQDGKVALKHQDRLK